MDGSIQEKIREIMRQGEEILKHPQYGVREENLRKRFTSEEVRHIEAVQRSYSADELDEHMEQVFDWYFALDYEESEEDMYEYYREMLKMKLK